MPNNQFIALIHTDYLPFVPGFGQHFLLGVTEDKVSKNRIYQINDLEYDDIILDVFASGVGDMLYDVWIRYTRG